MTGLCLYLWMRVCVLVWFKWFKIKVTTRTRSRRNIHSVFVGVGVCVCAKKNIYSVCACLFVWVRSIVQKMCVCLTRKYKLIPKKVSCCTFWSVVCDVVPYLFTACCRSVCFCIYIDFRRTIVCALNEVAICCYCSLRVDVSVCNLAPCFWHFPSK